MTEEQDQEFLGYLRDLSGAFVSIAKTMELWRNQAYPVRKEPRDAELTHLKTDEEILREEQGQTGERTITDWTSLGPRERAFIEKEAAANKR